MAKVKGGDLMLFIGEGVDKKSIGYATNHTFSVNAATVDVSNKDEGGGDWESSEVSRLSWSATSENFYADGAAGMTYTDLLNLMTNKTQVNVVISDVDTSVSSNFSPTDGWTMGYAVFSGKAIIESLELNAQNGEYATFTISLKGISPISGTIQ